MKALIVDDSRTIRHQLNKAFKDKDWDVEEADSGQTALEKLENNEFDLLVTDQNMPIMLGTELVASLRKNEGHLNQNIKTIFLTSDTTGSLKTRAKELGASAFALKPLNLKAFFKIINKVMEDDDD